MNDQQRRAAFLAYFADRLKSDRARLMTATGLSKGRIAQFFDEKQAFGERAARSLGEKLEPSDPEIFLRPPALPHERGMPIQAHHMSHTRIDDPVLLHWEDLLNDPLPELFSVRLPDEAMAPFARAGTLVRFRRASEGRQGACVLVRDASGNLYFRRIQQRTPSHWRAMPKNEAFGALDSISDGLVIVAVMTGMDTDGSDSF